MFEHALAAHLASAVRGVCAVVPGWLEGFAAVMERMRSDRVDFVVLEKECEMSRSLKDGWKHIMEKRRPDAVMISLADKPLVTSEVIDLLMERFAAGGCGICVPVFEGKRGHPVILSADFGDEILALEGDRGAKSIVEAHGECVVEVAVDSDGVLVDVDTRKDLDEVRRRQDGLG